MKKYRSIIALLLITLSLFLLIRMFVTETFQVSGVSMEPSLQRGDVVLVEKLSLGARLPITPMGVPYTEIFARKLIMPYKRLPPISSVRRGDLLVFNNPALRNPGIDRKTALVKRCIALPGDTVRIVDAGIHVNGRILEDAPGIKLRYIVSFDTTVNDRLVQETCRQYRAVPANDRLFILSLAPREADSLKDVAGIESVDQMLLKSSDTIDFLFPSELNNGWTLDNFGPVCIPAKGQTIRLDARNLPFYYDAITYHEGHEVKVDDSFRVLIDGVVSQSYTFRLNYYFMLGDNRYDSMDSRHWGLLPESHLIGKSTLVIYNKRGDRILRRLN